MVPGIPGSSLGTSNPTHGMSLASRVRSIFAMFVFLGEENMVEFQQAYKSFVLCFQSRTFF